MGEMADDAIDTALIAMFNQDDDDEYRDNDDPGSCQRIRTGKRSKVCKYCQMEDLWWQNRGTEKEPKWRLAHRDGSWHTRAECVSRQKLTKLREVQDTVLEPLLEKLKNGARLEKQVHLSPTESGTLVLLISDMKSHLSRLDVDSWREFPPQTSFDALVAKKE